VSIPTFKHKQLDIPDSWTIHKNDFLDLEPDNSFPIDEVFHHFDEDILNATYKDYCIDLGFLGSYLNDRKGFFKIVVFKGGFHNAEFFELFISRSTDEIRDKLNLYFKAIPTGQLDNIKGFKYDDNFDHSTFYVYSALDKTDHRLTNQELEEISSPKK
jgi:hypothetical protein